jgi:hypothetical protein
LVDEKEIISTKNISSSAMVFSTKILYKIFETNELIGHNITGKTFNKHLKNKKPLDEKRINYIKWLVENNFDATTSNDIKKNAKELLWKSCRTAINKSIRNFEIKMGASSSSSDTCNTIEPLTSISKRSNLTTISLDHLPTISSNEETIILQPNLSIFQMSNDLEMINKLHYESINLKDISNSNNADNQNDNIINLNHVEDQLRDVETVSLMDTSNNDTTKTDLLGTTITLLTNIENDSNVNTNHHQIDEEKNKCK